SIVIGAPGACENVVGRVRVQMTKVPRESKRKKRAGPSGERNSTTALPPASTATACAKSPRFPMKVEYNKRDPSALSLDKNGTPISESPTDWIGPGVIGKSGDSEVPKR